MADIKVIELNSKIEVRRLKKANLRLSIFTTEISKPVVTNLYMPHDGDSTKIADSRSLTVLLSHDNNVFYYFGNMADALKNKLVYQTSYDETTGLGNIIRQKQPNSNEIISIKKN